MIYDIHKCRADERNLLVAFIRKYWSDNHIFTYCDELLDFQHRDQQGNYNFFIAKNSQTGQIDGLIGYIPLSHFDSDLEQYGNHWGAIWKIRDDIKNDEIGLLGLLLFERLSDISSSLGAIGISAVARKFYKIQRQVLGELSQYYIKNDERKEFSIGKFDASLPAGQVSTTSAQMREVCLSQLSQIEQTYKPQKSIKFIQNRYFKHPIYRYKLLGVFDSEKLCATFVAREIETQNSRCIRIVDIYGTIESMPNIYAPMQRYLSDNDAEYIDCLNYGVNACEFKRVGFRLLDTEQNETIVPNYFEPFLRKNIKIDLAYKAPKGYPYMVFKGDADQDRPNTI